VFLRQPLTCDAGTATQQGTGPGVGIGVGVGIGRGDGHIEAGPRSLGIRSSAPLCRSVWWQISPLAIARSEPVANQTRRTQPQAGAFLPRPSVPKTDSMPDRYLKPTAVDGNRECQRSRAHLSKKAWRHEAQPRCVHSAFLHQQPQHAPHNQRDQSSRSQIFGNRHDCPRLIPLSEILLAIAPIPRRGRGNFSTGA